MMKIFTRIAVIFLMVAGIYFLREANINKKNVSTSLVERESIEEPTKLNTKKVSNSNSSIEIEEAEKKELEEKKTLKLKFEEKEKVFEERFEGLKKKSGKNIQKKIETKKTSLVVPREEALCLEVPESKITPVKIFLYEWELDISDRTIPVGKILFEVHNDGRFAHSLGLRGGKYFGEIRPGEIKFFTTDHLEKGQYEVYSPKLIDQKYNMGENFFVE